MAKYTINDTTLVAIADAIREKIGTTEGIDPANMAALIEGIQTGGGDDSVGIKWTEVVNKGNIYSRRPSAVEFSTGEGEYLHSYTFAGTGSKDFVYVNGTTRKDSGLYNYLTSVVFKEPDADNIKYIMSYAFYNLPRLESIVIPKNVESLYEYSFYMCTGLTTVTFESTPNKFYGKVFSGCANLTTINVPWAEGEVANAPWGATNATINYNYTGG